MPLSQPPAAAPVVEMPPMPRTPMLAKCGISDLRRSALETWLRWCAKRNISQQDVARVTGAQPKHVHMVFKGKAPIPTEWFLAFSDRDGLEALGQFVFKIQSRQMA